MEKTYQKALGSSHGILPHIAVLSFLRAENKLLQARQKPIGATVVPFMCPGDHGHPQKLATEMHALPLPSEMNTRS